MDNATFVHLSDLHLGAFGPGDPTLLSDTRATLAAVVAEIGRLSPPPRFAVASGDLTNRGDAESYRAVGAAMAGLGCPAVYALGNHDDRRGFRAGLAPGGPERGGGDAPAFGDRLIGGVHVVALDTSVPGRIGGAIDGGQFAWLEGALARHPGAPKVVAMHHPPAVDGPAGWDTVDGASADRLAGLLEGRPVAAVLSGHIHLDRVAMWRGVPVVTVSGQHAATDPLHADGLRAVRGASFGLCRLGPAGFSVTFVQAPSDRAELKRLPAELVRSFA